MWQQLVCREIKPMDAKESSLRILMFPWLAHGHVFPFLELSKNLSKRNFHIYFYSTPIILDSVRTSLNNNNDNNNNNNNDSSVGTSLNNNNNNNNDSSIGTSLNNDNNSSSIELVELHLPSLQELPPHYHTTTNIPPHLIPTLINAFQTSAAAFSDVIADLRPDLLIYDGFQPWAAMAAAAHGIPPVRFSTSGAASQSFSHHHFTHKDWDTFPFEAISLREHEKRARVSPHGAIKIKNDNGDFGFGTYKLSFNIVLIKSCRGFEGKYVDYLSSLCERKLVPTGPLIAHGGGGGGDEESGGSKILKWLSKREKGSTLYISFGSEIYLSKKQMAEIAKGLELSDVSFIWVARPPAEDGCAAVPEGFAERMRERGMVVEEWAPQTAILGHESVGGFMSHCGWSSVMESMYYGVPVVAVPFRTDQPVNARLVVEAGVGVEVERDEVGEFDGEGVAKAIKKVFVVEREGLRRRAGEMREKMKMEEEEAMDGVAEELSRLCG